MNKEEYDKLKLEKEKQQGARETKKNIKQKTVWAVFILAGIAIIGAGTMMIKASYRPLGQDYSKQMPNEGHTHVSEGTKVEYHSNPPTSGNHWETPLKEGIYNKEKPDEAIVHSLEHGRIWVSYKPTIPETTKNELIKLLKGRNLVILAPRTANSTDIALAAWEHIDTFNLNTNGTFDQKRILDFIARYKNKGPEYVPGDMGSNTYDKY